jgi:nucleotide-binding universal stress UspA family protein
MNIGSELSASPIVVGTDLSEASNSVVEYAAALALCESKPLQLVHVTPMVPDGGVPMWEMHEEDLQNQVRAAATTLSGSHLRVNGVLRLGTAAHELVRIANQLNAAYIVVGREGRSGLDRFLLGSVAEAVIRKSDRPVIVVGPQAKHARKTLPWKHLMLACETASGTTEAARLAGTIALTHHARLTIFNVKENGLERLPEDQFAAMEPMMSREAWLTLMPQCLIRAGDPAKEILRIIEDTQSDLLVMSVHSGGELLTHLRGGTIAKVLRMSRCPAMVLRDLAAPHQSESRRSRALAALQPEC